VLRLGGSGPNLLRCGRPRWNACLRCRTAILLTIDNLELPWRRADLHVYSARHAGVIGPHGRVQFDC